MCRLSFTVYLPHCSELLKEVFICFAHCCIPNTEQEVKQQQQLFIE